MATTATSRNTATLAAYTLGRSAGVARNVTRVSSVAGGAAVTALSGLLFGLVNARKWKRGKITGGQAIRHTARESVGMGVATGAGLAAANLVGVVSTVAMVPFLVGAIAATATQTAWNHTVKGKKHAG